MNKAVWIVLLFFLFLSPLFSKESYEFKRIEQWKHKTVTGSDFYSFINPQNQLVMFFRLIGHKLISANKIVDFAPRGFGPDEMEFFYTVFDYRGDLAALERPNKIKIYSLKDGTYHWKKSLWLKRTPTFHRVKDGIFYQNKFFFTGMEGIVDHPEKSLSNCDRYSFLKIYDEQGNSLKQLIQKKELKPTFIMDMKFHVVGYHSDRVFFMAENELILHVISTTSLEEIKVIPLEIPSFYKKMPPNFYAPAKKGGSTMTQIDLENWDMGYSSIQEVAVDGKYVVVSIRTANTKMKKFALLFYNADTYKLENTIFSDDYLLDIKDGKYYCFANGNPSLDDNTDDCIINIYSFRKKK